MSKASLCQNRTKRWGYIALLAVLLLAGCGKVHIPSGENSPRPASGQTPMPSRTMPQGRAEALFIPMEQHGAVLLSDEEAALLALALSPGRQKLASWKDLENGIARSLSYAARRPANAVALSFPGGTATWADLVSSLTTLQRLLPSLDRNPGLLAKTFRWLRLGPDFSFTGYYEPTIAASRTPTTKRPYPLYRRPPDLRDNVPFYSRNAIDRGGALRGKNLEIAYVDETDAFFLHIQGSGRLQFEDGSVIHALYHAKNNHKYVSLGRLMKERGLLPEDGVNMKAIRTYLADNPSERAELFDENPSYVFFRAETNGPIGSMGGILTPWVSLAVDRNVVPQGSVTLIATALPEDDGKPTRPFTALTLPQDSGGAIRGHRMDLFCGAGEEAEHVAGHLDVRGAVYMLLPR